MTPLSLSIWMTRRPLLPWVAATVFLLVALWGLYAVRQSLQLMREQQRELQQQLAEVKQLAIEYQGLAGDASSQRVVPSGEITALVEQSLKNIRFQPSRMQRSADGELLLHFDAVQFSELLAWLHQLETDYPIMTGNVGVVRTTSGAVSFNISLRSL